MNKSTGNAGSRTGAYRGQVGRIPASGGDRAIRSNKNPAGFYSAPIPCALAVPRPSPFALGRQGFFCNVVQKLQFLNNNRLKTKKNAGFLGKPAFLARPVQ
jgi:hypothetical protein